MSVPEHDRSIPYVVAHEHSSNHREEIERSELCGCRMGWRWVCLLGLVTSTVALWAPSAAACSYAAPPLALSGSPSEGDVEVPTDVVPFYDLNAAGIGNPLQASFRLESAAGDAIALSAEQTHVWTFALVPERQLQPQTAYTLSATLPASMNNPEKTMLQLRFTTGNGPLATRPEPPQGSLQHYRLNNPVQTSCSPASSGTCVALTRGFPVEATDIDGFGQALSSYLYQGPWFTNAADDAGSGGAGNAGGTPPSGGVGGADDIGGDAGSSSAGEGGMCSEQMCDPEPTQIVAANSYYCALLANHAVKCWGAGVPGFRDEAYHRGPAEAPLVNVTTTPGVSVSSLAAGYSHSCALLSDGTVKCWGLTGSGRLGYGQEPPMDTDWPPSSVGTVNVTSNPDLKVTQVVTARNRTCVLLSDGTVKCWGQSPLGALGYGIEYGGLGYGSAFTIGDDETPSVMGAVSITNTPGVKVTQIVAGESHNCALLSDGTVKCWGYPDYLGYGNNVWVGRDVLPSSVGSVSITTKPGVVATQLVAGATFTCALLSDASVQCWGTSEDGQLGHGDTDTIGDDELPSSVPPVKVTDAPGVTVTKVFTGQSNPEGGQYVCARLSDMSVKCWGAGLQGKLGYGNEDNIGDDESPSAVGAVSVSTVPGITVTQMAGSTCALLSNNTLQCWGGVWDPQCSGSGLPCSPSLPSALPAIPWW